MKALDLKRPPSRVFLAAACLGAALLLHLAPLLLVAGWRGNTAPPPQARDWSVFEITLEGAQGLGGDGLPDGARADKGVVASPLPRNPQAGPARNEKTPERAQNPSSSPKPKAEPSQTKQQAHRSPTDPAESPGRTETAHGDESPAETPASALSGKDGSSELAGFGPGGGPGHVLGIPHGSGGFGSGTKGVGIGMADHPARVVKRVAPAYPPRARRRGLTGRVVVAFVVDERGRAVNATVLEVSPPGVFEQNALEAVARWRFEPEVRNGQARPVDMVLPVSFTLDR